MNTERLRIAVQKSGRLSEATLDLLKRSGLRINQPKNRLMAHVKNMPIDILLVRDDDIPGLVMDGVVDIGFAGDNIIQEVQIRREERLEPFRFQRLKELDYGNCRLSIALPEEVEYDGVKSLRGKRFATSYPKLLNRYLEQQGVKGRIANLKGSVEVAPRAGLADAICDIVSTGVTLEANGLKEVEVIFRSTAIMIQRPDIAEENKKELINRLMVRINGVLQAKESKYIMLHAPKERLDDIIQLLPGTDRPTILPLASSDSMVAVHAVSKETVFWETMESLKKLGGSSILVLPIEKMLE